MNKIYDKLLLLIAVLLLAGGAFLYLQKAGQAPTLSAPVNAEPADNPYVPETVPSTEITEANWPEVEVQSTGWRYDVFTPPKIFIDEFGRFSEVGWEPPVPPPPFGIYLEEIVRKPYRIQLEGYIEEDPEDPSKTLLLMYNEEAQRQVRARPGDERPGAEFKLLSFDIERIRDADNNIEVVAEATILDQRTGEEVVLVHGERRYESGVTVIIRSELDGSYRKELTDAPAEFEGPAGTYTLLEINLEDSSVTVEKHAAEEREAEIRMLSARNARPSASPNPNPEPDPESPAVENENVFDLMFN
jgi:hypothetical protein